MKSFDSTGFIADTIEVGGDTPVLFSGPCAVESYDLCAGIAEQLKTQSEEHGFALVFKGSFDKANRTGLNSFRSIGFDKALDVLAKIKAEFDLPIVTDIHETHQTATVAEVADVLQIPAFLCRQTDLIVAAAKTGKMVKIKRGQFMAPEGMQYAVEKVTTSGNPNVCLTERGVSFGYNNLVVDMRALPVMRQYAPVIFDVTHSVQQPGGQGATSGGQRQFAPFLARAAASAGVDGFFIETHPDPANAMSDGPNMVPLNEMDSFLGMLKEAFDLGRRYT